MANRRVKKGLKKEKRKLSKKQGRYHLKKFLRNRGVTALFNKDIEDLYNPNLTYEQNKKKILKERLEINDIEEGDAMMQPVYRTQRERKAKSRTMDETKRAKKVYNPSSWVGVQDWLKHPNKVDIEGIDTPRNRVVKSRKGVKKTNKPRYGTKASHKRRGR